MLSSKDFLEKDDFEDLNDVEYVHNMGLKLSKMYKNEQKHRPLKDINIRDKRKNKENQKLKNLSK